MRRMQCDVRNAGVAQLVEHLPSKQRVAGSNPVSRSKVKSVTRICGAIERGSPGDERNGSLFINCPLPRYLFAHVAQSAEHFLGKEEVTGSIPVMGSDKLRVLAVPIPAYKWTFRTALSAGIRRRHGEGKI
ncbi:MAG: hypothetical protein FD164_546 [Nitrospirae bacterium]|nr:MAG: hypothetical protein FD164_546 [Nitrospirota bacterium]